MSQQKSSSAPDAEPPSDARGDPWHAVGYLVSGVMVYGFIGWLLDRWWGTEFMVALGILIGAGLGIYMTYFRFNRPASAPTAGRADAGKDEQE